MTEVELRAILHRCEYLDNGPEGSMRHLSDVVQELITIRVLAEREASRRVLIDYWHELCDEDADFGVICTVADCALLVGHRPTPNEWFYCGHCEGDAIKCGMCGNNCCNGGHGTVDGQPCPQCDSAYEEQEKGKP